MSQVTIHHPSSYGFSGQVGLPATVTGGVSATFSWQNLNPSIGHTVTWGGGAPATDTFTSSGTGTGSAAHTYANGTYTQVVTETATGVVKARRTFTVPYAGGGGFSPQMLGGGDGEESVQTTVQKQNGDNGEYEDYDPGDYTVPEVLSEAQGGDEDFIRDVLAAEQAGKNRSSLVTQLQGLLPFDPSEYTVADVEAYADQNPDQLEDIIAAEEAGKARVTLLNHLNSLRP